MIQYCRLFHCYFCIFFWTNHTFVPFTSRQSSCKILCQSICPSFCIFVIFVGPNFFTEFIKFGKGKICKSCEFIKNLQLHKREWIRLWKCAFLHTTAELTKYLLEKRCQEKNYKEKRSRNIVSNIFPGNFSLFEAIRERWSCAWFPEFVWQRSQE